MQLMNLFCKPTKEEAIYQKRITGVELNAKKQHPLPKQCFKQLDPLIQGVSRKFGDPFMQKLCVFIKEKEVGVNRS